MLSYSLSFYLFRSRRDLWPLFFPPRDVRRQNMRGSSNNRDTERENEIYRLESLPRCDIYVKSTIKSTRTVIATNLSLYLFFYRDFWSISNLFKSFRDKIYQQELF